MSEEEECSRKRGVKIGFIEPMCISEFGYYRIIIANRAQSRST